MLAVIREVGIFIVIAQTILFFAPRESYMKYVKVIVGIIMIVKIGEPVLALVTDGEWEVIVEQALSDSEKYGFGMQKLEVPDGSAGIYSQIEEEIRKKLAAETSERYEIRRVELREKEGRENEFAGIIITVTGDSGTQDSYEYLKEHYSKLLGMEASDVEIKTDGRGR